MRNGFASLLLLVCCLSGCASAQLNRPCGPGYLGNIFVPQGFLGADFRDACYGHDACYATPGADRKACDVQFLDDMNCACECSSHPVLCRMRARHWYRQVRMFGLTGYWKSQRGAGCDCKCECDCGCTEPLAPADEMPSGAN